MQDGKVHLEDLDDTIELIFPQNLIMSPGMFCLGSFAIVKGQYTEDRKILVKEIESPPAEPRERTIKHLGLAYERKEFNLELDKLMELEQQRTDISFIILSDVWLNDSNVLEKLNALFAGYNDSPPFAFVMFGNFIKREQRLASMAVQSDQYYFDLLCDLILSYPNLAQSSHFILIPGPTDGFNMPVIPHPPLPTESCQKLFNRVKKLHLATNPCR